MTATYYPVPAGDPHELQIAASRFGSLATAHSSLLEHFKRHVSSVLETWTGPMAARYQAAAEGVYPRFTAVATAAAATRHALNTYAAALEATQEDIDTANRGVAELQAEHLHDPVAASQVMGQYDRQADEAGSALRQAARTCAMALADAQTTLAAACPDTMSVQQLHAAVQRATAALSAILAKKDPSEWEKFFGTDGLIRRLDEAGHAVPAPFADMILFHFLHLAEEGAEGAEQAGETTANLARMLGEDAFPVIRSWRQGSATWDEVVAAVRNFSKDWDPMIRIAGTSAEEAAAAAHTVSGLKGVGAGLNVLAMIGDGYTLASPEDGGAMGWVDRVAAGGNFVFAGWDTAVAVGAVTWIPGVGEAALVGTGLYLAGDYLYHHWNPFTDVSNDVGHATVSVAKGAWHDVTSWL